MKSKSSLLALVGVSLFWLFASLTTMPLRGQSAVSSPSVAAKPKAAYIRFWNMLPLGGGNLELVLANAGPTGRVLQNALPANFYAGYLNLPPGTYPLAVFRSGNRATPLQTFNITLRPDSYITILATQLPGGQPTAEMLDNTPDPKKTPVNRLTIHHFVPDARILVTAGDTHISTPLANGAVQTLENLPDGLVPITMSATLPNGIIKTWNTEADFRTNHRASLLIFSDSYGRIRPRVSVDGPSRKDEAQVATEAARVSD